MRICLRRREFIAGLGSAATWPLAVRAQQAALPVIGWLSSRDAATDHAFVLPAFHRGLNSQGFVEGRNVAIEYRFAEGQYDRLPMLVSEFIRRRVAVMVAVPTSLLGHAAIKAASSTVPVVSTFTDPVGDGLVASINRPGGNITGVITLLSLLGSKRLGLLHELVPRASTIAVFANPASNLPETTDLQEAAPVLGLKLKILHASTERDLNAAFASLPQMGVDALYVTTDPFFFTRMQQIVSLSALFAIPTLYFRREFASAGGLMSYGTDAKENYGVLGDYAGRILKGEKAGELPIQQPTRLELVINLKTAKALALDVPPTLLARADEIIE
jgi:putative ABC transport system substrate-binding protein